MGVLPATFDFSSLFAPGTDVDLVLPLNYDVVRRQGNTLAVIGRLRPGRTLSQARADLEAVTGQLKQERPDRGMFYGSAVISLKDRITVNSTGRRNTSMMRCCDAETETETVRPGGSACDAFAWSAAGNGACGAATVLEGDRAGAVE